MDICYVSIQAALLKTHKGQSNLKKNSPNYHVLLLNLILNLQKGRLVGQHIILGEKLLRAEKKIL